MADIAQDEHFAHRHAVTTVGDTPMQNLIARLSATPGVLHHEGRPLDADGADIRERGWAVFEKNQETS
jgi:crotonobetainyl-CoA:carnitine CoA-transferase CaiB-like acyl-CoA transferase